LSPFVCPPLSISVSIGFRGLPSGRSDGQTRSKGDRLSSKSLRRRTPSRDSSSRTRCRRLGGVPLGTARIFGGSPHCAIHKNCNPLVDRPLSSNSAWEGSPTKRRTLLGDKPTVVVVRVEGEVAFAIVGDTSSIASRLNAAFGFVRQFGVGVGGLASFRQRRGSWLRLARWALIPALGSLALIGQEEATGLNWVRSARTPLPRSRQVLPGRRRRPKCQRTLRKESYRGCSAFCGFSRTDDRPAEGRLFRPDVPQGSRLPTTLPPLCQRRNLPKDELTPNYLYCPPLPFYVPLYLAAKPRTLREKRSRWLGIVCNVVPPESVAYLFESLVRWTFRWRGDRRSLYPDLPNSQPVAMTHFHVK
jgi:hypothetical protein